MRRILLVPVLFCMLGCAEPPTSKEPTPEATTSAEPPYLLAVAPAGTVQGAKFNAQADGSSAFPVTGKGFYRGAVIMANGQKLGTVFGNPGWLTAAMPADLYENAGVVAVKVLNANGKVSNSFDFTVTAKK